MSRDFWDDDNPFSRGMIGKAELLQIVKMCEDFKEEVLSLRQQNESLTTKLSKSQADLKLMKSDRDSVTAEFNTLKNRFSGLDLEGKYVKCLTAMYAISNGISEESSKTIVDALLKELGEKK